VVPNRGRDIGAFLVALAEGRFRSYGVVGHIHGKRSPHVADEIGRRWRNYLWQNLVGGKRATADAIIARFAEAAALGLVFPEDPHIVGWDQNRDMAEALARRMNIPLPLPDHFDFPVGTMFWARPESLAPLVDLKLTWEDFPDEPVPIDGTILHALERLIPFVVARSGYRFAVTCAPDIRR
jgi:lipopolysaccharide biosynthesis protein